MNDQDSIDRMLAGWQRTRPDVDARALAVVQRLIRGGRRAERRLEELVAVQGLRVRGDYETLGALRRAEPASLTPHQLAAETQVSSAGMTSRLDRLEANGYVVRTADTADRRSVNVALTDAGRRLVDDLFAVSATEQALMLDGLKRAEIAQLGELLHRILRNLDDR